MATPGKLRSMEKNFAADEGPRADTSAEALARLKPAFHAQGRSRRAIPRKPPMALPRPFLMDAARARELGIQPLARLVAYAATGCLPEEMGIGPITAIPKALEAAPASRSTTSASSS